MNVIDIVILAVMAISVIYGLYRGFLHTILSVACCLISLMVAFTFGPRLSAAVSGSQGVYSTLATYTDAVARVGDYGLASTPVDQLTDGVIHQILQNVSLPASIAQVLENNLRGQSFAQAGYNTVNQYVTYTVVGVAVNVLCFLACFIACYLVLSVIVSLIQHVFRLPILKQLDWLAGGAFGFVRGFLLLHIFFLVIPILSTVIPLDTFNELLAQSTLAGMFQSNWLFGSVISWKL